MSDVIVFAGPSIPRESIDSISGFEWRPPVSQGDVYRAAKQRPRAIAIIDGYFEGVPSVWHKEILWAMSRGIHVFGASSMGALRAAELHTFGMRGVGEVFEKYRDGVYEDDDEVAVQHGPVELGFLAVNVPMVNVRATVESALNEGVLGAPAGDVLIQSAKSIFYPKRQWEIVLATAVDKGMEKSVAEHFSDWLPNGERDIKREDAARLVQELQQFLQNESDSFDTAYQFEWTVMWDRFAGGNTKLVENDMERDIVDELRMQPDAYSRMATRARLKQLALREAERKRVTVHIDQTRKRLSELRERLGLYSRAQLDEWMRNNELEETDLQTMLEEQQKQHEVMIRTGAIDNSSIIQELRAAGDYECYKKQALKTREEV